MAAKRNAQTVTRVVVPDSFMCQLSIAREQTSENVNQGIYHLVKDPDELKLSKADNAVRTDGGLIPHLCRPQFPISSYNSACRR